MPIFYYKAKSLDGNYIEGSMEATSRDAVHALLRQQSAFPISINEKVEKKEIHFGKETVDPHSLAVFCQQFATIIKAGIPYVKCIEILRNQTKSKALKRALDSMYKDIQSGASISESMEALGDVFPEIMIQMVSAGESSGTLESVMNRLGATFENEYKIKQKIKSALAYPVIVGSLAIIVCIGLLVFILPRFENMFSGADVKLPLLTRILMGTSDFLVQYGWVLLISIILGVIFYKNYTSRGEAKVKKDKNRTVGSGTFRKMRLSIVTATFCRTLSSLLSAGVNFTDSLTITSRVLGNDYAKKVVLDIEEKVRRGESLASMLKETDYFPEMVYHLVGVGEETGAVDEMLLKAAEFYEGEVDETVSRLASVFEPLMIIVLGLVVGIMVVAIVMPMFQLSSLAGGM